ncbi:MAG: HlyD family efflux transporter periplasmic adaptor subunit, partial [Chlorobiaceae bacterium]|nr:HlyD family efflux transporter periplasmic adaptor subunit [Chlorobiaceae bacterium]
EPGEITSYGKPLYKIADLGSMYLRAYLSGTQLSSVRIGDEIDVLVDGEKPASKILRGRITWISSKAEFTPKIIQTREDRVTMVYAVKVLVDNKNGFLKIGMPGEIRFRKQ